MSFFDVRAIRFGHGFLDIWLPLYIAKAVDARTHPDSVAHVHRKTRAHDSGMAIS